MNSPTSSPTIGAPDIKEYLESADDFAFECEVYSLAKGLGFEAEHAGLYIDPITAKPRQFDVRATLMRESAEISLALECKGLKPDFPLLVSRVPRAPGEGRHDYLHMNGVQAANGSFTRVQSASGAMYRVGQMVGKSMRQVRRKDGKMISGDEVFDKWTQSLSSLAERVSNGAKRLSGGVPEARPTKIAFLPALVVSDNTLWVADYSSRGTLQADPKRVAHAHFYLGRRYELEREQTNVMVSHLHIVTRSAIGLWLQEMAAGGGIWQELFP